MLPQTSSPYRELFSLLQLCSGTFPIGAFSHSFGLESMVENHWLNGENQFEDFCGQVFLPNLGQTEAPGVCLAMKAGNTELAALDQEITALKPSLEMRTASLKMGGALLRTANEVYPESKALAIFGGGKERTEVNFAIIFGVLCAELGIETKRAGAAFLFSSLNSFVQAAIKLVPIGQIRAQAIITRLYNDVEKWAEHSCRVELSQLGAFNPQLDIASMNHEGLYCRLYMS